MRRPSVAGCDLSVPFKFLLSIAATRSTCGDEQFGISAAPFGDLRELDVSRNECGRVDTSSERKRELQHLLERVLEQLLVLKCVLHCHRCAELKGPEASWYVHSQRTALPALSTYNTSTTTKTHYQ